MQLTYDLLLTQVICSIRKQRQIKQQTLACKLGVQQSTYSRMESGKIFMTPGQLKTISEELDVSICSIFLIADQKASEAKKEQA